ncbi:hypothetical protein ACSU6B_09590 [Neobacillus sp. C211]|uniref:hypothetical protein n=1 Tax=unclassified Neobacillus TaxID=2675272 RepID=UPI00397A4A09
MRQKLETEVIVIGGGMTGAGVLRDLSLRGIKTVTECGMCKNQLDQLTSSDKWGFSIYSQFRHHQA